MDKPENDVTSLLEKLRRKLIVVDWLQIAAWDLEQND